jgi:NO-binding membrane sensor protein with MHYT domain
MHVNGFAYGALTPALAYAMSCIGSVLGLQSMSRARSMIGPVRYGWIVLGAASIGGTGIWVMHFVAMLGFSVAGAEIRYDVPTTLASMAVAVLVVGIGLSIVVRGGGSAGALLTGGFFAGSGVAAMHYLGMAAVHMDPVMHYDLTFVALSEVLAVAAATAAFWATWNIRGAWATIGAALVMGVAVTGMHYTGMEALSVTPLASGQGSSALPDAMAAMAQPSGLSSSQLLTPLVIGISVSTVLILLVVAMAPTERELKEEAELDSRTAAIRARR